MPGYGGDAAGHSEVTVDHGGYGGGMAGDGGVTVSYGGAWWVTAGHGGWRWGHDSRPRTGLSV